MLNSVQPVVLNWDRAICCIDEETTHVLLVGEGVKLVGGAVYLMSYKWFVILSRLILVWFGRPFQPGEGLQHYCFLFVLNLDSTSFYLSTWVLLALTCCIDNALAQFDLTVLRISCQGRRHYIMTELLDKNYPYQ